MPFIGRLILALGLVALGLGVLYVGMGGLGKVVGAMGSTVGGFVEGVTATATPRVSVVPISDAPTIAAPEEPYTTAESTDLTITVPSDVTGDASYKLRIYLALKDQAPAPIDEVPIAGPITIVPVTLTKGVNDFTVTIVGPSGESDPSPVVRFVLDTVPPKITIQSPKNGATVNRKSVTIKGKTQGRTTLIARNAANGASITADALGDGTFSLTIALAGGVNAITIDGTDPAGNVSQAKLTIKRGTGKLTVSLSASDYQIKRSSLPEAIKLTAIANDPDGRALAGADVTFTLSIPGIPTVTLEGKTSSKGAATFKTTIPKGADVGQGSATVLVSSSDFGSAEDYTVITIRR
jgi:Glucodextranase, domain B